MPRLNGLVTVSKGNGQNGTGEPREDVGVCDGVSQILGAKVCTQARLTLKPNSLPLPGSGTLGFGRVLDTGPLLSPELLPTFPQRGQLGWAPGNVLAPGMAPSNLWSGPILGRGPIKEAFALTNP